ncbi:MAG: DUF126 domain-containing protein [Nitrososphaeria archaeon]
MNIKAEVIVEGPSMIRSTLKVIDKPISFLGMVNPKTGILKADDNPIEITGVILSFPYMIGSTVAPYIIYSLKKNKKAPLAIISSSVDALLASGCAISDIPLLIVSQSDFELLKKYKERIIKVNTKSGEILIDEQ